MSIRKHSETTRRPAIHASSMRHRAGGLLVAASLTLGVLAGCAEGTSQDAERGKARDAQETSVVSDLQATHAAGVLLAGTPTPEPTGTPEP